MAISAWLILAGVCLLYVAIGLWAVSRIFPCDQATTPGSHPDHQQERPRT
jgi:hypothetical protein